MIGCPFDELLGIALFLYIWKWAKKKIAEYKKEKRRSADANQNV